MAFGPVMGHIAVIAAAAAGLLLGLVYRVPALLAATVVLIAASSLAAIAGNWPLADSIFWTVFLTVTLQASYLAGVALARLLRFRQRR
jgi:hypothetical protein